MKEAASTGVEDPLLPTRNLIRIAIDNISYCKGLFPRHYFEDKFFPALDMNSKMLMPMDALSGRVVEWLEHGLYDALQNKYLKTFHCSIHENENGPMIEEYSFSFNYPKESKEEKVEMEMSFIRSKDVLTAFSLNAEQAAPDQMGMLETLVSFLKTTENLSQEMTVKMKLIYDDGVTPEDYVPPFFMCHAESEINKKTQWIETGKANKKCHVLAFKVQSVFCFYNDDNANNRDDRMSPAAKDYLSSGIKIADAKVPQIVVVPVEGTKSNNDDSLYMKALYHALLTDYVTINKLRSMLLGEANKLTVRMLINKMVQDGFLSSTDHGKGKPVIHSEATKSKLIEIKKILDIHGGKEGIDSNAEHDDFEPKGQITGKVKRMKHARRYTKGDLVEPLTTKNQNKLKLSLDGTPKEVEKKLRKFSKEVKRYYYSKGKHADVSSVLGRSKKVFTTPKHGTLYVDVTHESDCLIFVIQARHGWMRGYIIDDVVYELKPDAGEKSYMPHPKNKKLSFKGNHRSISSGNPGGLTIGLYKLRKAFKSILESGGNPDPEDIGRFVLYLCEGPKLKPVLDQLCKSLVNPNISRLDVDADWMDDLIHSWGHSSREIMRYLDYVDRGLTPPPLENKHNVPGMDSIQQYLANVRILHLDAYEKGLFAQKEKIVRDKKGLFAEKLKIVQDIWEDYEDKVAQIDTKGPGKKLGSGHGFVSHKTEVRPYDSVHKRSMSTVLSYDKLIYGDYHVKSVQGMQSSHGTKTVQPQCCLQVSQKYSKPRCIDNMEMPTQALGKFATKGAKKSMQQFRNEASSITKSYMTIDQAKIVQPQGLTCLLPSLMLSKPRCVHKNLKMPMRLLCNFTTGEVTKTMQGFKSEGGFITKSYMTTNQTKWQIMHHQGLTLRILTNQKLPHTRRVNRNLLVPIQPVCSFIGSNMNPNKTVYHEELTPRHLKSQKLSRSRWVNSNGPMPLRPICSFIDKEQMAGVARNTRQLKTEDSYRTMPSKKIKQVKIECIHDWIGPSFSQKVASSQRIGFSASACRLLVRILHKRPR